MMVDRFCSKCQLIVEDQLEKMEDSGNIECPICKEKTLERVIHYSNNFAINGFSYRTGYSNTGGH